jgi:signal transduction histidine kinase
VDAGAGGLAAVATPATPATADTAVARGEYTIAVAVAISRFGALLTLLAGFTTSSWHGPRALPVAILSTVAVAESVALIVSCLVLRRLTRFWAGLDVVCVIALIGLSAVPAVLPGRAEQSPWYNFSVVAVVAFGLARWPLAVTLAATGGLALANLAAALRPGSGYPFWNAVPDSATYVGAGIIGWIIVKLLRTSARSLDRHREATVARAAALATEWERARQRQDLGAHLLSTMDELAAGEAITDPQIREQVRRETQWLHQVVDTGLPEPEGDLLPALRDLVAEKTAAGMRIELVLPEAEPELAPAVRGAVVAAVREALTNVAKHAGTARATVTVHPAGDELAVEIADAGGGYDPGSAKRGLGQQRSIRDRITGVGGRVEIESALGSGTRVRLWVPLTGEDVRHE